MLCVNILQRLYISNERVYSNRMLKLFHKNNKLFTKRDMKKIKLQLKYLHNAVKDCTKEIETKGKLVQRTNSIDLKYKLANAYEEDYFNRTNSLNVTTVFLSIDDKVLSILEKPVARYSSNNCSRLLQNRNRYHTSCVSKEDIFNYSNESAFHIGLPAQFNSRVNNKQIVTFLHILQNATVTQIGDVYLQNTSTKIVPQ